LPSHIAKICTHVWCACICSSFEADFHSSRTPTGIFTGTPKDRRFLPVRRRRVLVASLA
jgi:hypothetical protein